MWNVAKEEIKKRIIKFCRERDRFPDYLPLWILKIFLFLFYFVCSFVCLLKTIKLASALNRKVWNDKKGENLIKLRASQISNWNLILCGLLIYHKQPEAQFGPKWCMCIYFYLYYNNIWFWSEWPTHIYENRRTVFIYY